MNKDGFPINKFASEAGMQKVIEIIDYFLHKYKHINLSTLVHWPKYSSEDNTMKWRKLLLTKKIDLPVNEMETIIRNIDIYKSSEIIRPYNYFNKFRDSSMERLARTMSFKIKKYQSFVRKEKRKPKSVKRSIMSSNRVRNRGKFIKKSQYHSVITKLEEI